MEGFVERTVKEISGRSPRRTNSLRNLYLTSGNRKSTYKNDDHAIVNYPVHRVLVAFGFKVVEVSNHTLAIVTPRANDTVKLLMEGYSPHDSTSCGSSAFTRIAAQPNIVPNAQLMSAS